MESGIVNFLFGNNYPFILILITTLTLIFNIHMAFKRKTELLARERLEKVVYPLFLILEKYLFADHNNDDAYNDFNLASDIIVNEKLLSGWQLTHFIDSNRISNDIHSILVTVSHIVSRDYDVLCKSLGLSVRPFKYKFKNYRKWDYIRWQARYAAKVFVLWIVTVVLNSIIMAAFLALLLLIDTLIGSAPVSISTDTIRNAIPIILLYGVVVATVKIVTTKPRLK